MRRMAELEARVWQHFCRQRQVAKAKRYWWPKPSHERPEMTSESWEIAPSGTLALLDKCRHISLTDDEIGRLWHRAALPGAQGKAAT